MYLAGSCPKGKTWFGNALGTSSPHDEVSECSNAGKCNYDTGVCLCMSGFTGIACDRSTWCSERTW